MGGGLRREVGAVQHGAVRGADVGDEPFSGFCGVDGEVVGGGLI